MSKFLSVLGALAIVVSFGAPARAEEEVGPHKGAVVEWGDEEYHLELVPDAKAGSVTVYVYGSHTDLHKGKAKAIDAKTLVLTIKAEKSIVIKLEAKPGKDDPEGKSSLFVAKHEIFSKDVKLAGAISGKVGAKPYTGEFKQK